MSTTGSGTQYNLVDGAAKELKSARASLKAVKAEQYTSASPGKISAAEKKVNDKIAEVTRLYRPYEDSMDGKPGKHALSDFLSY